MGGGWTISQQEIDRYRVMQKVLAKELKQNEVVRLLGISTRQVRNLQSKLKTEGPSGAVSASSYFFPSVGSSK